MKAKKTKRLSFDTSWGKVSFNASKGKPLKGMSEVAIKPKAEKMHLRYVNRSFDGRKTLIFEVFSLYSGEELGLISWCFGWRQYVFEPYYDTRWSWDCLEELSNFILDLNTEHKKKKEVKTQ
jgi:hypothetical protein